jgi:predicted RNA-binding Zn ribbon-like protein
MASDHTPLFLADHGALDFLNTVMQVNGQPQDMWQSDEDVMAWLTRAGLASPVETASWTAGELLQQARRLRETIRTLVAQKKAGETLQPEGLNDFLASIPACKQLRSGSGNSVEIVKIYPGHGAAHLLGPVAELAASLLAEPDFELIRTCEHPDCTLWFYDRTKSHRRRWCSMALCGNRAKVARFRQQQK